MKLLALVLAIAAVCLDCAAAQPLVWKKEGEVRRAQLPQVSASQPGFTRIDPASIGIQFTNILLQPRKLANANLMNGSGIALGDYDGDGFCDVYLCDLNGNNRMYKNLGDWKFRDVTEETGTACPKQTSSGATFADINGDGLLDLLVTSMGGPHACFINLGNGRFTNVTIQAGITSRIGATSMALGDIDGNGTVDLYVCDYGLTSILRSGGALNVSLENGRPVVKGRYAQRVKIINGLMWELGEPDALYLNDGKGNFTASSWTTGRFLKSNGSPLQVSEIPWDQGLSVMFRDINGDGAPDIYVCNDAFTPDRLWINDGKGNFRAMETLKLRTTSHFSMGVDFGDLDRDGKDEFMVVDMLSRKHGLAMTQKGNMPPQPYVPGELDTQWQMRRNTLEISDGCGGFSEVAFYAGIAGSEWSWAPIFLDVDLDGWEDILISNGFENNTDDMDIHEKMDAANHTVQDGRRLAATMYPILATPNVAFHNGHDLQFEEVGKQWGFDAIEVSNGMALADFDNDGDLDVVVNCLNAPPLFYRNNASGPRVGVRVKGRAPNTQGVGARVTVEGGPVKQSQEIMVGGRYLSGDDPMRVFAAGSPTNRLKITVVWRNGTESVVNNVEPGYVYEIDEATAHAATKSAPPAMAPMFAQTKTEQKHTTDAFDDFAGQPSLPFHLNAFGPGTIFADINSDGFDDLITGAGRGGNIQIALNDKKGSFASVKTDLANEAAAGVLAWPRSSTETELLVSLENFAKPTPNNIRSYTVGADGSLKGADDGAAFQSKGVGGPLALTELNGEITLFWGARFAAGRYPESAPSHLYRFRDGKWILDSANEAALANVGLVSGAAWSDLDGDGSPELILACQWSPLRVFSARDQTLVDRTEELGFGKFAGLWLSVATADVDGDGRMDLIAGNWGLNSFYNQAPQGDTELYYGEFNGPGQVGIIETFFDDTMNKTVPWRDKRVLSASMPWLNDKFATHADFSKASIDEILQGRPVAPQVRKATTLANAVFLNRGSHFEFHPLPRNAQYAPAFGIVAADFDNDGAQDLFLAQNFFAVREFDSRLDAGRGLLLHGDGKGGFTPVSPTESGIQIYGEQRGCAVGDFNHDGKVDLLVAQYANETKFLANQTARAGISIRLTGDPKNLAAAGAQFQIGDQNSWGPLQEIQIGSGYWSQSSLSKVGAAPKPGSRIRVRWPGAKDWNEAVLPDGKAFEISRENGALRVKSN
jgi:hypothetical protein